MTLMELPVRLLTVAVAVEDIFALGTSLQGVLLRMLLITGGAKA